jgi:hypothetical protein
LSSVGPENCYVEAGGAAGKDIDFCFLPKELTERSRQLIESYHGVHGYTKLADLLWHAETREFIALHCDLWAVFRKASLTRSAKRANECYVLVATILFSLEVLANDFAGWGKRFPQARLKVDSILCEHLPNARTWLMDFYLYQWRRTMDRAILSAISPPPARLQPHVPAIDFRSKT